MLLLVLHRDGRFCHTVHFAWWGCCEGTPQQQQAQLHPKPSAVLQFERPPVTATRKAPFLRAVVLVAVVLVSDLLQGTTMSAKMQDKFMGTASLLSAIDSKWLKCAFFLGVVVREQFAPFPLGRDHSRVACP